MAMPSSKRHRFVKIREEIVRSRGKKQRGQTPYATGVDPQPRDPTMRAAHEASVKKQ